jgi:hypothetical protein
MLDGWQSAGYRFKMSAIWPMTFFKRVSGPGAVILDFRPLAEYGLDVTGELFRTVGS